MSKKSKGLRYTLFVMGALVAGFIVLVIKQNEVPADAPLRGLAATVYRSATCGCCANYIAYLKHAGVKVDEEIEENMPSIKKQFGVPAALSSCHTTRIGNYTVEGHIPVEGIQKLLAEKPNVSGIALPQMPAGSPGMPGRKFGPFEISSFDVSGSSTLYFNL